MAEPTISTTEHAVLGVLAERPTHGFAIAKELSAGTPIGRILTVRRTLVYRALDRLVESGLAEPTRTERGLAGPQRVIHRSTRSGLEHLGRWLAEPVSHVRDMRIEFQLKLALLARSGSSYLPLVRAQRRALEPTLNALDSADASDDHVGLWRRNSATATAAYLDQLEEIHTGGSPTIRGQTPSP